MPTIHNNEIIIKNKVLSGGIYLQGGACDRCMATNFEARLSLIHPTLAKAKKDTSAIPYSHYTGEGSANLHISWAGGASQTIIITRLAGDKYRGKSDHEKRFKNAAYE